MAPPRWSPPVDEDAKGQKGSLQVLTSKNRETGPTSSCKVWACSSLRTAKRMGVGGGGEVLAPSARGVGAGGGICPLKTPTGTQLYVAELRFTLHLTCVLLFDPTETNPHIK